MILLTYGTRPEFIKIKPLISGLQMEGIPFKILFTGQHNDIADGHYDYRIYMSDKTENRLDNIISNIMLCNDDFFSNVTHILVQGDTTSVVGLSLAAIHRKIKVIHLEAGLRTYDYENPYPEEYNRRIVSSIASIHLCPTNLNAENLKKENVHGDIYVVGNTVLDNLIHLKDSCVYDNKILVTLHRRENHIIIDKWFTEINNLAIKHPELEFIIPLHPNPNIQAQKHLLTNINVINPLTHTELLKLLTQTKLVITDSGGLQEECSFFNKICLVCRKTTERVETIGTTSFLIESPENLIDIFENKLLSFKVDFISPYGNGDSGIIISKLLKKILQ